MPSTSTVSRMMNVIRYDGPSGSPVGRNGVMISVQMPPTTMVSTIRVWMRPYRVGTISAPSDGAMAGPAPPLSGRRRDAELLAETELDQVVGDLLGGDLQAQEGVDAGEVATQRGATRRVHPARLAARADHLEASIDVEPADRVPTGARMIQQIGQYPVLPDVGLQAGAVDDEIRVDLDRPRLALGGEVRDDALAMGPRPQLADLAGDGAVPALPAAPFELFLPVLADRRVGAAHFLVRLGAFLALEAPDLGLELATPDGLGIVEALIGPAVAALAAFEDVRAMRAGDVGAEHMDDLRLQVVAVPVVDQPLQDPGGDDAAAADHHGARAQRKLLVHVLVRLVGVHDPGRVPVVLAIPLQVGEQFQARVADGDVHERAAVGQPLRGGGPGGRSQDREVAALPPAAHHPHLALADALLIADAVCLALHGFERLAGLGGVVVLDDRFGEHVPQRLDEAADALGAESLPDRVGRETPDVVRSGFGVGPQPFAAGNLRHPGQILVALPGRLQLGEHGDVLRRDAVDAQEVDGDERSDTTTDGDELGIDDRDAGALHHLVGPDIGVDQFGGQITPGRTSRQWLGGRWRRIGRWRGSNGWLTHPGSPLCRRAAVRPGGPGTERDGRR